MSCFLPTINRLVSFLRSLRIIILVRIFRLASQKKEMEKVTRRMVRDWISKFFLYAYSVFARPISVQWELVFRICELLRYQRTKGGTKRMDLIWTSHTSQVWVIGVFLSHKGKKKKRWAQFCFCLSTLLFNVPDRVIAMSFPSSGKQALYRNPIRVSKRDVVKVVNKKLILWYIGNKMNAN